MTALVKAEPARQAHMLPQNFDEATRMATAIAQSGLFGCKTTAEAFSLMLLADAEGLHPAAAARDYHIIEGRPSLKADAMLARYMAAGGKVEWLERSDTKVAANFTHPASGTVMIEWTIERAKAIKRKGKSLTEGDNWKNYARQMLAARTISEGVRASFPGVVSGVYTPEEVQDFEPAAPVPRAVGQLAAPEEPGQVETPREPLPSVSFTVDKNDDGVGKGKSAYAARRNGDWEKVEGRLDEGMREHSTRRDCLAWWQTVIETDEEYRALPSSWRQMFVETVLHPYVADLPEMAA